MSSDYQSYTETFFQHLGQAELELAVNTLFQTNPWIGRNLDQINNINSQLKGLPSMAGDYLGFEVLIHKTWKQIYAVQNCLAIYDRQPVNFDFHYYKPRDEWRIQNFNVSFDFPELASNVSRVNFPQIFEE